MIEWIAPLIESLQHSLDLLATGLFPFVFLGKSGGPSAGGAETSLTQASAAEIAIGRPLRSEAISLGQKALETGAAPDSSIPEIQRALEQVLAAGSQSRQQTTDLLSQTGLDRTPYGANILSNVNLQALLAAAGVPVAATEKVINRGLSAAGAGTQVGISGLGQAAGVEASRGIAGTQQGTSIFTGLTQAGATLGGAYMTSSSMDALTATLLALYS